MKTAIQDDLATLRSAVDSLEGRIKRLAQVEGMSPSLQKRISNALYDAQKDLRALEGRVRDELEDAERKMADGVNFSQLDLAVA